MKPSRSPAAEGYRLVLTATFARGEVASMRHRVAEAGEDAGLEADAIEGLVIAINEIMTNAVRHGGGSGRLRLWVDGGVLCEVTDDGAGFAASAYVNREDRPAPTPSGGMGLWIAQQTTDGVGIDSGPSGTTVRIVVRPSSDH